MSTYQPGSAVGVAGLPIAHQGLGAGYPVTLPLFEGPLDLLLHLIVQKKLDISEISLVAVTDQYLQTLEQLEELVPGALADFLVVASRLLYMKSTQLLPRQAEDEDEEESGESLVQRLLEYRRFKRVAEGLRELDDESVRAFARSPSAIDLAGLPEQSPDYGDLDSSLLQKALRRALQRTPVTPPLPQIQPYRVTVAERIQSVRRKLSHLQGSSLHDAPVQLSFESLLEETTSRLDVIVTFLAVLELVKQREVEAHQEMTFGEIMIRVVEDDLHEKSPVSSVSATSDEEQGTTKETSTGETQEPKGD